MNAVGVRSKWRGLGWTHEVVWSRVDVVQQLTPRRCPTARQRTKDVVAVQRAAPGGAAAGERDEGRQEVRHVEHAVVPASILPIHPIDDCQTSCNRPSVKVGEWRGTLSTAG